MCERETAGKTGESSGSYACVYVCVCVCASPYNVRTHVCVASRARMRRERRIVVIAYFIMDESETDNQARGRRVGGSLRGRSVQACSRIKQVSSPRFTSARKHKSDANDNSQQPMCTVRPHVS